MRSLKTEKGFVPKDRQGVLFSGQPLALNLFHRLIIHGLIDAYVYPSEQR
jgi:hypothetical protein